MIFLCFSSFCIATDDVDGCLHLQVARQDILAGVADFAVIVCMTVTVTARQDTVKLDVRIADGALAVYWVIACPVLLNY